MSDEEEAAQNRQIDLALTLVEATRVAGNVLFLLTCGIFIVFMQTGFAFVEAGLVQHLHVVNILLKNFMDMATGCIIYALVGYALTYGESLGGWIGSSYYLGDGIGQAQFEHVFFNFSFAATASTIVSGAIAGRAKFSAYLIYSALVTGVVYPIAAHWVWNENGWLGALGYSDFAGGAVVHALGGAIALLCSWIIGPRLGRFSLDRQGKRIARKMPPSSLPFFALGCFILVTGFIAFNAGSAGEVMPNAGFNQAAGSFEVTQPAETVAAACWTTMCAFSAGSLMGMLTAYLKDRIFSIMATMGGGLCGLVSICAGADVIPYWGGMIVGGVAGPLCLWSSHLLELLGIDDPVDAVPVHLVGGVWGVIARGFFFPGDTGRDIGIQLLGCVAICAWSVISMAPVFLLLKYFGALRVTAEMEEMGLDKTEHEVSAYAIGQTKDEESEGWQINEKEVIFDDPEVILGSGSFGRVLRATYQNSTVAVKMPLMTGLVQAVKSSVDAGMLSVASHVMAGDSSRSVADPMLMSGGEISDGNVSHRSEFAVAMQKYSSFTPIDIQGQQRNSNEESVRPEELPKAARSQGGDKGPSHELTLPIGNNALGGSSVQHNSDGSPSPPSTRNKRMLKVAFGGAGAGDEDAKGASFTRRQIRSRTTNATRWVLKQLEKEAKLAVKLRHPNIVSVYGTCVTAGKPFMVMEMMELGDLSAVLSNVNTPLDWRIAARIAHDIVKGLKFLHSQVPPVPHSDLKSSNVLLDGDMRAKLGDFGLAATKAKVQGTPVYMAPELLRGGEEQKKGGSSEVSDIFALGIVLWEIFTREAPYANDGPLAPILEEVKNPDLYVEGDFRRPRIPSKIPTAAKDLLKACWAENPGDRPSVFAVEARLLSLDSSTMESFYENQAKARESRRASLSPAGGTSLQPSGPKTARQLLHSVFPPAIAEAIQKGEAVQPQRHDEVTIFFSDIVGFTTIGSQLLPEEIMLMLDRLYRAFDELADQLGVFKVETIGDAWMGVTNLACPQPDHAVIMATFSLGAIQRANTVPVHLEKPELGTINIRVGFHTGSCVASVVGTKNPRFCLFGDTVSTASRMESNSERNKIHISDTAAAALKRQKPDVRLESRGTIQVKGKGEMETFWVIALEGGGGGESAGVGTGTFSPDHAPSSPIQVEERERAREREREEMDERGGGSKTATEEKRKKASMHLSGFSGRCEGDHDPEPVGAT